MVLVVSVLTVQWHHSLDRFVGNRLVKHPIVIVRCYVVLIKNDLMALPGSSGTQVIYQLLPWLHVM